MMAQINNEIKIAFPEEFQSDSTIQCHLSPEISAVDMEIRWFKETDCVCFYKNRRLIEGESYEGIMSLCIENLERGIVSLQLQDVRESHVGDYLCQVTSEDRTAEITIRKSSKSNDEVPQQTTKQWFIKRARTWTNEERIKMANSALLAVFNKLEKTDAPKEDLQGVIATVPQTDINVEENQEEAEEKNTQQVHKGRHMNDSMGFPENVMETSTCKLEEQKTHLGDQQPGFSSVPQTDINVEENQEEAEEKNTQQVHKGRHMNDSMGFPENVMETSTCKLEEQKTHLGDQQPGFSSGRCLSHL
uniref:Ig-like domain-containing protein n=1 Tax=Cyprinus carpio TaxID=7962 RepID=A0A8C1MFP7_CYPCA